LICVNLGRCALWERASGRQQRCRKCLAPVYESGAKHRIPGGRPFTPASQVLR